MDNDSSNQYTDYTNRSPITRLRKPIIIAIIVIIVLVVGLITVRVHQLSQFRITTSNPSLNNVATISPFLKLTFNRQLTNNGFSISSSPSIITGHTISGNQLDLTLNSPSSPLNDNKTYTITLSIAATDGERITNKQITFTPKYVPSQDIPKDQGAAILQHQVETQEAPSKENINFVNEDALINDGVTTEQIDSMEQAFFLFDKTAKSVTIDASSVQQAPVNPASTSSIFTMNFTVTIDQTTYQAQLNYNEDDLASIELFLTNSQGTQVYDSGVINTSEGVGASQ
jgi:hypothetical protein